MEVVLKFDEGKVPEDSTLVVSFPGIGMVGGIAAEYLIDYWDMEEIGQILVTELPPVAIVHRGRPRRPIRIFKKNNLLLIKSDMIIPSESCFNLSQEIAKWAAKIEAKEIITIDSMPSEKTPESENSKIWGVVSDHEIEKNLENIEIPIMQYGILSGPNSMILVECVDNKLPAYGLYAEANPWIPDAQSTANILKKLSKLINKEINVENLLKRAEEIRTQYEEMVHRAREENKKIEKEEPTSSMYR